MNIVRTQMKIAILPESQQFLEPFVEGWDRNRLVVRLGFMNPKRFFGLCKTYPNRRCLIPPRVSRNVNSGPRALQIGWHIIVTANV